MSAGNATFFFIIGGLALCIWFANGVLGQANNNKPAESNSSLIQVVIGGIVILAIIASQGVDTAGLLQGFSQAANGMSVPAPQFQPSPNQVAPQGFFYGPDGNLYQLQPQGSGNVPAPPAPALDFSDQQQG